MNGFFNINKPAGMSSAAVVGVMKRLTGEKRVGHAGTLDPEAAGVLPIMVGRATRLFDYLVDKRKEYETVCAFGFATDTQDATGEVTERGENYPSIDRVREETEKLTGDIIQKPSMYSAIKVGGKPLYVRARKGETVDVPERTVRIDGIDVIGEEAEHGVRMRVRCGKGTYIRSVCDDLGKLCGCPAHMRSLTRIRSGYFVISEAMDLDTARELAAAGTLGDQLIPMDAPLGAMMRTQVPEELRKAVAAGAKLAAARLSGDIPEEDGVSRIYLGDEFWGIAMREGENMVWRAQMPPEEYEKYE